MADTDRTDRARPDTLAARALIRGFLLGTEATQLIGGVEVRCLQAAQTSMWVILYTHVGMWTAGTRRLLTRTASRGLYVNRGSDPCAFVDAVLMREWNRAFPECPINHLSDTQADETVTGPVGMRLLAEQVRAWS